jgi:RNA polymerase sigma factor (sigma-70 family)
MGGQFLPPDDLAPLFDKPGRTWSYAERLSVQEWLNSGSELAKLLRYVVLHLGSGTTFEDAEDTWAKYNIYYSERHERWISRLHNVMKQYDPEKGSFCRILLFSLKRFCWAEGDSIRGQDQSSIETGDADGVEKEEPETIILEQEEYKKLYAAIKALPANQQAVIKMYYFEEMSVHDIAEALNRSESWVKVNLFRGRQNLKGLLGGGDSS